ncbi:MAG: PAS domain-containing sensor histidine kinase [Cyanobacteria bacterium J06638_7]
MWTKALAQRLAAALEGAAGWLQRRAPGGPPAPRRRAERALALTEAIPVGTFTASLPPGASAARFVFLSEPFLQICGLTRPVLQGAEVGRALARLHPQDRVSLLRLLVRSRAGTLPCRCQVRVRLDRAIRWLRVEAVPRRLADGSTLWEGALTEVSAEVQGRQRLEEQQRQLRRILNCLPVAVAIHALEPPREIVFLNRRFLELFGYSAGELPDVESWCARACPDPVAKAQAERAWSQALTAGGGSAPPASAELTLLCRDRSRREVIMSVTPLENLMLVILLDLTERNQDAAALELALRREADLKERQRRELEAKLRSSLTAAAVAHEINQPLSSMLINTQMLLAEVQRLPAGNARSTLMPLLELQLREAERVVDTIERMRMLLRNVRSDQEPIDLAEVVESALVFLSGLLRSAAVRVERSGLDQPRRLLGDAAQLQIAVANVIRNAVDALDSTGVHRPRLQLSLARLSGAEPGGWLELRIADNGPGFSDLRLDQLLLSTNKAGGSGIGLFVAATAVENHAGILELRRSAALGGAEVLIRLPSLPDCEP